MRANVGKSIDVYVKRRVFSVEEEEGTAGGGGLAVTREALVKVAVAPRAWAGRGVLGCHLLPLSS